MSKLTSTPMVMSLDMLRKLGYYAEPVEHRPYFPGMERSTTTRDLLGFADILALREHVLLVQTTSRSNVSAHMKKIQASVAFEPCRRAGVLVHVHGWDVGGVQVTDMTARDADGNFVYRVLWESILRAQKAMRFK